MPFRKTLSWLGCMVAGLLIAAPASARVVDGVAAIVNEDVVLVSEINDAMRPVIREYRERYAGDELRRQLEKLREAIVSKAIEDKLILQVAKKVGITADESQVEERYKAVVERFPSEQQFEEELRDRGITAREYRAQIAEQVLVQETIRSVIRSQIQVTENEISEFYKAHRDKFELADARRVRVIYLPYPQDLVSYPFGQTRQRAEQIALLVDEGANFAEMARKFSEGPHRSEGGDLGFVTRGSILPELEEVAFTANVGGPPAIVETTSGVYMVAVTQARKGRLIPLSEAREHIQAVLTEQQQSERYERWIAELKEQSYIERKL